MSITYCYKQQPQPWMYYITPEKIVFSGDCCPALVTDLTHLLPFQVISQGAFQKLEYRLYGDTAWTEIAITYSEVVIEGFYFISYNGEAITELPCGVYEFKLTAGEVWWFEPIKIEDFTITENTLTVRDELMTPFKISEQIIDTTPLIAPCDMIMPFMFRTENVTSGTVTVYMVDESGTETEITITVSTGVIDGMTYYWHSEEYLYPFLSCGRYYLKIVDGANTYYSVPFVSECGISDIPDGYKVLRDFNGCVIRNDEGVIEYEEASDIPEPEPPITDISFGLLYNAYVVRYNTGGASIAPTGWHIPTEDEWFDLFDEIATQNTCGIEMMESGTTHWSSDTGTNESGFTAVGNGWRKGTDGTFERLMSHSPMWTSNSYLTWQYAFYTQVANDEVFETMLVFPDGCAIRLIKDDDTDPGTVTDYDGNIYETVKIGTQVWTKSNLIVKHFNNGVAIPEVTLTAAWTGATDPAWCYYNNDPSNM